MTDTTASLPVILTDGVHTVGIDGSGNLQVVGTLTGTGSTTISGLVSTIATGTTVVSGTVNTVPSGTQVVRNRAKITYRTL